MFKLFSIKLIFTSFRTHNKTDGKRRTARQCPGFDVKSSNITRLCAGTVTLTPTTFITS